MKQIYIALALLISAFSFGQIPAGYYNTATGTGYTLKTQLYNIINDHNDQGYDEIQTFFSSDDRDVYYENDNSILDVYSENPSGNDPYNFFPGDECGNYDGEGDCFNPEHVIPQSVFNSQNPMQGDAHELLPTDGRVNGLRSNLPFGVVGTIVSQSGISNPTLNGSKMGNNLNSGYSAGYTGLVFEPIDEFKGDIARIYFYFATRYENVISGWNSFDMFDGSSDKVFDDTFLSILMTWHENDPVSQKEIDRNNAIYQYQNNRNPFIDHPEYAMMIWNPTPDTEAPSIPINLVVTNEGSTSISLAWTASTDNVAVTSYDVYVDGIFEMTVTTNSATVINLTPETTYSFTVIAKDAATNESDESAAVEGTTTEAGQTGTECESETFTGITTESSTYATVSWTGDNGLTWNATSSRTDQTIIGKALTMDMRNSTNATLTSTSIGGGMGSFTLTTQRKFTGGTGNLSLYVNGVLKGSIPYDDTVQTTTISDINVEGTVTVVITEDTTGGDRVAIDDLSWTCYTALSTDDFDVSSIKIYPNPVKNELHINLNNSFETTVEIYNVLGRRMLNKIIQNSDVLSTENLSTGVYILKLTQGNQSITKKLIKQ
jgi:endonuclease I/chitodextrinase